MSIARRAFPSGLRVEETGRILQRRALGEGKLHDILVGFASADDAIVRPNRSAHPLPLLDDVRVCFLDELAHSAEGFPAPVPEFGDFFEMSSDADWPWLAPDFFMFSS